MEFGVEKIMEVAAAARLSLSREEAAEFAKELEDVLKAFEKLGEADVDGLEPAFLPIEIECRLRCDEPIAEKWRGKTIPATGPKAVDR